MKREIIQIASLRDAVPKKFTWYKYYDDTFISIIGTGVKRAHLRLKNQIFDNKKDNKKCFWHCDWQYNKIESTYGITNSGKKTYEVSFQLNKELHIVDSIVESIGIEFQHSLGVSIEEMDSRYEAQVLTGLTPYLVLDFTNFNYDDMGFRRNLPEATTEDLSLYKDCSLKWFLKKVRKWEKTKYYINDKLLIDLEDGIIRISNNIQSRHIFYTREYFIRNITILEKPFNTLINEHKILKRLNLDNNKKEWEKRREKEHLKQKETEDRERRESIRKNDEEKKSSESYKYYRNCLNDKVIYRYLGSIKDEVLIYHSSSKKIFNPETIAKVHEYLSWGDGSSITYTTYNLVIKDGRSSKIQYSHAVVEVRKKEGEFKTISFKRGRGKSNRTDILGMSIELFSGFYHSFQHPARYVYEQGKRIREEYFLFNIKLDKKDWEVLSPLFQQGIKFEDYESIKYEPMYNKIELSEEFDIYKEFEEEGFVSDKTISKYKDEDNYYDD